MLLGLLLLHPQLIKRERALLMLMHCLDTQHIDAPSPTANPSSSSTPHPTAAAAAAAAVGKAPPASHRLHSIHSLVSVTATLVDVLAWHMQKELPVNYVALDRPLLARMNGYVGEANFRPFERDNRPTGKQIAFAAGAFDRCGMPIRCCVQLT
jgi:hypothetical protein